MELLTADKETAIRETLTIIKENAENTVKEHGLEGLAELCFMISDKEKLSEMPLKDKFPVFLIDLGGLRRELYNEIKKEKAVMNDEKMNDEKIGQMIERKLIIFLVTQAYIFNCFGYLLQKRSKFKQIDISHNKIKRAEIENISSEKDLMKFMSNNPAFADIESENYVNGVAFEMFTAENMANALYREENKKLVPVIEDAEMTLMPWKPKGFSTEGNNIIMNIRNHPWKKIIEYSRDFAKFCAEF